MLAHVGNSIADEQHGQTVRQHVQHSVGKAVRNNNQVSSLRLVPVLGSGIEKLLENAVTDIVTQSIINLLQDMNAQKIENFIDHGLNSLSEQEQKLDEQLILVVNECLELVKSHVGQQRWKDHFNVNPS
jgi:adenosyl cobinamide kinase/adenosyl cobinamide phosphate guanylyltransferase